MKSSSKIIAGVVVLLAVACFAYWIKSPQASPEVAAQNPPTEENKLPEEQNQNPAPPTGSSYKDGTYNVVEDYISPGGKDSLGVSITLKGGNISAVTVKNMAGDRTSEGYQNKFISGINSAVTGKSIADLKIGVVSGASLASGAFNKALVDIKAQASN